MTKTLKLKHYRIVVECSEELKTQFKAAVALKDERMQHVLTKFMRAYTGRQRDELDRLMSMYKNKGALSEC